MIGAWPPSSSDTFFICAEPSRIKYFPTLVEPVKVIMRTSLFVSISFPIASASPVTRLTTPAGIPASSKILTISIADNGVSGDGFNTAVQPAASAGPSVRVIMDEGEFQGVIAPTTPTGCGMTSIRLDETDDGIHSPYALEASSAYHNKKFAAPFTSPIPSWSGLPCSVVKISPKR